MFHISWSSYKLSFSVCVPYLLILLQVLILCMCSISPDPITSSHYLSVFYIFWSYYRFTFSVCVLYLLILSQVFTLSLCSISPDPIIGSHSQSVFYISWSYYRLTFSVCVLYHMTVYIRARGPGGSMNLLNNSYKHISNTVCVHARLYRLQKRVHSTRLREW
jgi:hypothetical protein